MPGITASVRRGRKYDQVLKGAREIFLRDGFEGASVDEIARTASSERDRAQAEGTTVEALAGQHSDEYMRDMAALNVHEADVYPRATQEVPKIIEVIAGLGESFREPV